MKYSFLLFSIIISTTAVSQNGFDFIYERPNELYAPFTVNGQQISKNTSSHLCHLVFNDSLSFTFFTPNSKKYLLGKKPDFSKLIQHSNFFKRNSGEHFFGVAFPNRNKPYFVRDSFSQKTVYVDSVIKKYKNWRCREAYVVLNPGDTLFALLAIDYPYPYSPFRYPYFNAIPLELYHPKYDFYLRIKKIEQIDYDLLQLLDIPVISFLEHQKLRGMQH
jgi:hypothetical protein